MAKTSKSAWAGRERLASRLFKAERNRCSGSSGRPDCSRSDSTHERLFLETKLRAKCATISLFDATRTLARAEGKVPVLMLARKHRPGFLVCLDSEDLGTVLAEYMAAQNSETREGLEGQIRTSFLRQRGELDEPGDTDPEPKGGE